MKKEIKILITIMICIIAFIFLNIEDTNAKYIMSSSFDVNINLTLDVVPPVVNITDISSNIVDNSNNEAISQAVVNYFDELSGIETATYKYNSSGNNFSSITSNEFSNDMVFSNTGWYEITVTDRAKNKTVIVFQVIAPVARIKETLYTKLEYAINDVPVRSSSNLTEDITIYMLKNVTENNTIPNTKDVILDINSTIITGNFVIESGGDLIVKNGTVNNIEETPLFNNKGNLTINSGTYNSSSNVINNEGNLILNGGTLKNTSTGHLVYQNRGELDLYNVICNKTGTTGNPVYIDGGIANIYGGNFNSTNTYFYNANGTLNINGVDIRKATTVILESSGITNIINGNLIVDESCPIIYVRGGTTNMQNGTVKYTQGNCCDTVVVFNGATFNMSGGSIIQPTVRDQWCCLAAMGEINISGDATIKNTGSR